ncbi:VOC family protein [Streptomyces sp. NPDC086080]|uniref:VOC family protein n=1 Tax=Streptomyces sp. NPDC086080 TaxID=3365748 RepID=UPI0037D5214F
MSATIKELAYVGIEADDLDAWSGFAGQLLGLMPARHEDDIRTFRLDDRVHRTIIVRGPRNDLAFAGFDCGSDADLDEVVALLRSQGHDVTDTDPGLAAERGVARIHVTADPEGNRVELLVGLKKADEPYTNQVNKYGFQTRQGGAGHMVLLCTPGGGRERMLEFYGHLGFKLSDYIKDEVAPGVVVDIAFTHCNGRHHTLAFAEMPAPFKLHHFMIENNNMSDVGLAYDRVVEAGVPLLYTLGMHPNDKMFSFYAHSPSGIAVEYGWGGLIIEDDDTWEITEYDSVSAWGHKNPMELGTSLVALAERGRELQEAAMKAAAEEAAK